MRAAMQHFRWAFVATAAGLVLAFWLGWRFTGTLSGAMSALIIGAVLAVLEISLSFDNAIVNANKLKDMTPVWQRRFLTWGIVIAVFGMRIVFPLAIVAVAAHIGPLAAIKLAATDPETYADIIGHAHLSIAAFGGTFLMMVGLSYFVDEHKEVDWFCTLECRLRQCASVRGLEIAFVLVLMLGFASALPGPAAREFLFAALFGLLTFTAVELLGHVLDAGDAARDIARAGGLGAFLYLEVLDASFSFDGVIGAFALTQNLFLIAIGLGIGAMYVRSLTLMLVERKTLAQFRYLEHGAFYSILALSVIMYAQTLIHISELVTGALGAALIGLSLWSSIRYNRRMMAAARSHDADEEKPLSQKA
ncbi:DUF475 domain-containing protein [Acidimangrovimonas pyrenivorans]|uniref:DUF475 domain-containing protein n=1 Tax=Acidimangrovimonas pyrenivorans TaxID=2030798 RepID=A0ABV7ADH5_9RHOB